ncbi:MAG: peptidoglycan bridge formation glycyltransferase FemA/FemB family protein [Candidatus Daviesbacteria bacterium]|nr:peptidoglycan bridge formation glycyltransferase FemA/FemB family protein [Candidatus Daviesbacteria bacterium]
MELRVIPPGQKYQYNKFVTHVIQSWQWGDFRKDLGLPVLRYGIYHKGQISRVFQLTLHKIPFTKKYVGYLPKGPMIDQELVQALKQIGKQENCAFIKVEPDVKLPTTNHPLREASQLLPTEFIKSPKSLFTKYNFVLDITKSEEELLKNTHPKVRYNIRLAQKYKVTIKQGFNEKAFETYLKLYFQTVKRQGYLGHNETYHKKVWGILKNANMARLLIAYYKDEPLACWMLLNFHDTLYYPYGGSSMEFRNVMASNLLAWEAILLGKKMGLKKFDMWGALGPNASPKDPWFGFHKFKQGYGGELEEYIGTYDYVFDWPLYLTFTAIDKLTPLKVFLLKLLKK